MVDIIESGLPGLLLLAPGFLTLTIHDRLHGKRSWGGPFEKGVLSLMLSSLLAALFFALNRISTPEAATAHFFAHPLRSVIDILLLSTLCAFVIATLTLYDPLPSTFQKLVRRKSQIRHEIRKVWDRTLEENHLKAATVTLENGRVYYGYLYGYSTDEEETMVTLAKARDVTGGDDHRDDLPSADILLKGDLIQSIDIADDAPKAKLGKDPDGKLWIGGFVILVMALGRIIYAFFPA